MHDKVPPHRGEGEPAPSTAVPAPKATKAPAGLLRLQRSAGNAATTLLLQRIAVSKHDKLVLAQVDKKKRKAVKQAIKDLPASQEAQWRQLSDWLTSKQTKQELIYLTKLYEMLLDGKPFSEIAQERAIWMGAFTMPTGQSGNKSEGKNEGKSEGKGKTTAPPPGFGIGRQELTSALRNLKPRRDDPDTNASSGDNTAPVDSSFDRFPEHEQAFLLTVFQAYVANRITGWEDVYFKYYKRSDVKAGIKQPNADDYVTSIRNEDKRHEKGLPRDLGVRVDDDARLKSGGYPLTTTQGSIGHRVYINVHVAHAAEVFGHVHKLKEVSRAKLGSYDVVSSTRDSIVVYTENEGAAQKLFHDLADYQSQSAGGGRTKAAYFVDEIVHMTQPVPGLIGVSQSGDLGPIALRKANVALRQSERGKAAKLDERWLRGHDSMSGDNETPNLSFSELRSMLIYTALLSSKRDGRTFQQDVVRNFQTAGLSSAAPWESGKATPDLIYLLRDLIYEPYVSRDSTEV